MPRQITSQDREFLGRAVPKAEGDIFSLDNNTKRILSGQVGRLVTEDQALQLRVYNRAAREIVTTTSERAYTNEQLILASRNAVLKSKNAVLLERVDNASVFKSRIGKQDALQSPKGLAGVPRATWNLETVRRASTRMNPRGITRIASESVVRLVQPSALVALPVEQLAKQIGLDPNDPAQILTEEFVELLSDEAYTDQIKKYGTDALTALTNSPAGLTALSASALNNSNVSRLLDHLAVAGTDGIPLDTIDNALLARVEADVDMSDDSIQRYVSRVVDTSSSIGTVHDVFERVLTLQYGLGLHAHARRNLYVMSDIILSPLLTELGVTPSELEFVSGEDSGLDRFENVGVAFSAPGLTARTVLNAVKKILSENRCTIGIAVALSDRRVLLTMPFVHNGVFIRNLLL